MGEAKTSGRPEAERPKSKVIVIFPAVNEEKTVGSCIAAAKQSYHPEIIVVDGYSTNNTVEEAKKAGAEVIFPEKRMYPGKGLAMKTGLEAAFKKDADVILFHGFGHREFKSRVG